MIINIINDDGKIFPKSYKLPLEEELILPENVRRVSIFEGQEGNIEEGFIAFDIIVGKVGQIKEVFVEKKNPRITCSLDFVSCHDKCVYKEDEKGIEIFSHVEEGNLVVPDVNSLITIINYLSKEVCSLKQSVNRIKELRK